MQLPHMSDSIDQMATALSQFQGQMRAVHKSSQNPHLKNRYASLEDCWDAIREPLSLNGLSLAQFYSSINGEEVLITLLTHTSGQWIKGFQALTQAASNRGINDDQARGSALSYARRYALTAMLGLTQTDDDAASATPSNPKERLTLALTRFKASAVSDALLAFDVSTLDEMFAKEVDLRLFFEKVQLFHQEKISESNGDGIYPPTDSIAEMVNEHAAEDRDGYEAERD